MLSGRYRKKAEGSLLPWTQVAEPRRESGGGVAVRVVEVRVAGLALLGKALLQRQHAALLVVAETVPESGRSKR